MIMDAGYVGAQPAVAYRLHLIHLVTATAGCFIAAVAAPNAPQATADTLRGSHMRGLKILFGTASLLAGPAILDYPPPHLRLAPGSAVRVRPEEYGKTWSSPSFSQFAATCCVLFLLSFYARRILLILI